MRRVTTEQSPRRSRVLLPNHGIAPSAFVSINALAKLRDLRRASVPSLFVISLYGHAVDYEVTTHGRLPFLTSFTISPSSTNFLHQYLRTPLHLLHLLYLLNLLNTKSAPSTAKQSL